MTSWIPQPGALGSRGIKTVGSRIYTESQHFQMTLPLRGQQEQQTENENSQTEDAVTSSITSSRGKKGKTAHCRQDLAMTPRCYSWLGSQAKWLTEAS